MIFSETKTCLRYERLSDLGFLSRTAAIRQWRSSCLLFQIPPPHPLNFSVCQLHDLVVFSTYSKPGGFLQVQSLSWACCHSWPSPSRLQYVAVRTLRWRSTGFTSSNTPFKQKSSSARLELLTVQFTKITQPPPCDTCASIESFTYLVYVDMCTLLQSRFRSC